MLASWYVPVGNLAVHVWKYSYNDSVHPQNLLPVPSPFQPLLGPPDLPPFRNQRVSTLQSWALQELTPAAWLSSVLICQRAPLTGGQNLLEYQPHSLYPAATIQFPNWVFPTSLTRPEARRPHPLQTPPWNGRRKHISQRHSLFDLPP